MLPAETVGMRATGGLTTVVLCGGRGTRAHPHTVEVPKPLLEVDGRPILHHLLEIYARQGHTRFVLAAGYKHALVADFAASLSEGWDVVVVDTGEDTNTGRRIRRCAPYVDESAFFATYADGLGDVDLCALLAHHCAHDGAATLTTVPLPSQYGTIETGHNGRVACFREKPRLPEHRINAGFFVFDRRVFDVWEGDDLEREVLPDLARRGELFAYEHEGFWKSMDTYKDAVDLSALAETGRPPWFRGYSSTSRRYAPATHGR